MWGHQNNRNHFLLLFFLQTADLYFCSPSGLCVLKRLCFSVRHHQWPPGFTFSYFSPDTKHLGFALNFWLIQNMFTVFFFFLMLATLWSRKPESFYPLFTDNENMSYREVKRWVGGGGISPAAHAASSSWVKLHGPTGFPGTNTGQAVQCCLTCLRDCVLHDVLQRTAGKVLGQRRLVYALLCCLNQFS